MNILLIEPDYSNKYPPIGLMKISTYHKCKGDKVRFYKGIIDEDISSYDYIYITTLFSFHYDLCMETINYYEEYSREDAEVFVGGISATIMPREYSENFLGKAVLIEGQLTDSSILGFDDGINIDDLITDYDILDDIDYEYPDGDSYYLHLSRGCVRNCTFCAVKKLEPKFFMCRNQIKKIEEIDRLFGVKKHLKIMDNNVLYLKEFPQIVESLVEAGFGIHSERVERRAEVIRLFRELKRRIDSNQETKRIIKKIYDAINEKIKYVLNRSKNEERIRSIEVFRDRLDYNKEIVDFYLVNEERFVEIVNMYRSSSKIVRKVDFNQGLDARAFKEYEGIEYELAKLNLEWCRIAFDDLSYKEIYLEAMEKCYKAGIRHFSNYLLYNYLDTPEDLYERMVINIQFYLSHEGTQLFSFPMRYIPITAKERSFIGKNWSKIELDGFYAILNVTRGVVAKEKDFFMKAYGRSGEEFRRIILMPTIFIKNRKQYEKNEYINMWSNSIDELEETEIDELKDCYVTGEWTDRTKQIKKYYYKSMHEQIVL